MDQERIRIINATEHNLRGISIDIPRNKFIVVTGVSGSGKSSLVFDVLFREAEYRFFSSFSAHARQFLGKMHHPEVEKIGGLSPAIAIDQQIIRENPRSTVGTITGIYDLLRLLFARTGIPPPDHPDVTINRSLFSFNTPEGACPACKGLGVADRLDPELIIADEDKSIREGALVITAPNGYIIYSQVTLDVLDQVCRSEGFTIDIPWKEMTPEQRNIIWYGSEKLEIPFGKHPLESRMRWSGITAKPREMGYYKGILTIMEAILNRERNKNILRFVRTVTCPDCEGRRLNENALSVRVGGWDIARLSALQLDELQQALDGIKFSGRDALVASPILEQIRKILELMIRLGLNYLSSSRESSSLSGGESQRMRLAMQAGSGLQGILYLFDEPSVGLHPSENARVIEVLRMLQQKGNTVIVVEHDEDFIRQADHIIDIGPGPGKYGGEILLNSPVSDLDSLPEEDVKRSRTLSFLKGVEKWDILPQRRRGAEELIVRGAEHHNLKNIDVSFRLHALNVVAGVSGAGKSSLTGDILVAFLRKQLHGSNDNPGRFRSIEGWEPIRKVISIDQSPIGRTPRSNPATYTGLSDHIRDLFAGLPEAKMKGFGKGRFSFNTAGGRCETCQGAGYIAVGMHFMGNVELLCEECEGRRFDAETLQVRYKGKNISEILEMEVEEALAFFSGQPPVTRYLKTLDDLGLGYLRIGQRSTTLSGGEAQRIKLAAELARPSPAHTLYMLDEPTTGLHNADAGKLVKALDVLISQGNTVILVEHHPGIIALADHVVELGPGSGKEGGYVVYEGEPQIGGSRQSAVGSRQSAAGSRHPVSGVQPLTRPLPTRGGEFVTGIRLKGVTTNNLKNISVDIPHNKITVITGVSGSGKSSLAFDTIFHEGYNRFIGSLSSYSRMQVGVKSRPDAEEIDGLTAVLAIDQRNISANPRSTMGTMTGIYDLYRLLFSRIGDSGKGSRPVLSSLFSFNHQHGACPECRGLGSLTVCDPAKLITHPARSILDGAMDGTKTGKFYGDPYGQFVATIKAVGAFHGADFSKEWKLLSEEQKKLVLAGTGDEIYDVTWEYKRDRRTGEHHFKGQWVGLIRLVNGEYERKHADHRGEEMSVIMKQEVCFACRGARLCPEALGFRINGKNIAEVTALTVSASISFFREFLSNEKEQDRKAVAGPLAAEILQRLEVISGLSLSYLSPDRVSMTLSGGEIQRIKLAGQIGSGLTGLTYVLDEPTIGLHPKDVGNLMETIGALKEAGNTIIIVEHDRDVILAADHVIDVGPGAGRKGGKVMATGSPAEIMADPESLTGRYLREEWHPEKNKRILKPGLSIRNAYIHNLKNLDLEIPSGGIIAVTGVSGSGKSSLLFDVILSSYERKMPAGCDSISGFENFDKIISVGQQSFFTSSSGTPGTYTGIFDRIRELFARTEEAKARGFRKNHFSFLGKEGRCTTCLGMGKIRISMDFLSDVWIPCESCNGLRYRPEMLECHYLGKNISEILEMSFSEASSLFKDDPLLEKSLKILEKVGLDYIQPGQPLDTLSGGEAQRLILATELIHSGKGKVLYLFDEPGTGLHFKDIRFLIDLFQQLADQGHTLIFIEHQPDIIRSADHEIRLGPGGGEKGGRLI